MKLLRDKNGKIEGMNHLKTNATVHVLVTLGVVAFGGDLAAVIIANLIVQVVMAFVWGRIEYLQEKAMVKAGKREDLNSHKKPWKYAPARLWDMGLPFSFSTSYNALLIGIWFFR